MAKITPLTEGKVRKGGRNEPNTSDLRPPAPKGSGGNDNKLAIIAADLLEALSYYVDLHERNRYKMPEKNEDEGKQWLRTLDLAKAAIAKAVVS